MKKFVNLSLCAAGALAIAALAPGYANAAPGTAANAKILNVVTVTYYDATGNNQHQAATSTSVVVALKQAPLTVTTSAAFPTVDSGVPTSSLVALTANANGSDSYTVTLSESTSALTSPTTIVTSILSDTTGGSSVAFSSGQTVTLGATSILSVQPAAAGSQVISIPGGTLNGIATGSVVVINGISYKVTGTTTGTQAAYSLTGQQTGLGSYTSNETPGSITIATDPNGSNQAPNLSGSLAGTIVGERKYLKITDTALVTSNTGNGSNTITVSTDTTPAGNSAATTTSATFLFVSLSINKTVTNVTNGSAGATGKPGDVLEYTVIVDNASAGNAGKVSIADAVPAYTTLVSGTGVYGSGGGSGAAGEKFATVSDATNTVDITLDPTDSESQSVVTGFGGTQAHAIVAGTPITFYLGTDSTNALGGTVAPSKTYTIKYRVKID